MPNLPYDECPKCGSEELEADGLEFDEDVCWRIVTCPRCGFEYGECFAFKENYDINTNLPLDKNGDPINNV